MPRQTGEVEQARVEQMGRAGIHQGTEHHLPPAGRVLFPAIEDRLDLLAQQTVLRPAKIARYDRVAHGARKPLAILFGHMRQRPVDEKIALFVQKLRRHGRQPPAVEQVHEEGFEDIVAVVAQNDRGTAFFAGKAIKMPAAETRAKGAIGPARGHLVGHDRVGVLVFNPVRNPVTFKKLRQNGCGEPRLALIKVAGQQVHRQKAPPFELIKHREERIAILAARQADQPAGIPLDHAVLLDRFAGVPHDPLPQLAEFGGFRRIPKQRVDIVGLVEHGWDMPEPDGAAQHNTSNARPGAYHGKQLGVAMRLIALFLVLGLAACGTPSLDDPKLSDRKLDLEEFFDGRLIAYGQFQDLFGTVRRRFEVEVTGDWDGERLRLVEDFVYEDGATEQRIWTLTKTGADTWVGTAPGVIGQATGEERGDTFNWQYTIDLPIPSADGNVETLRASFDDWMWLLSDDRLLNRAYMRRFGVPIGEVIITFEKL